MAGKRKPQQNKADAPVEQAGDQRAVSKVERKTGAAPSRGFDLPFSLPDKDDAPVINLERLKRKMPWLMPLLYSLIVISFIPLTNIYYNRTATHSLPRWSLIPDMDNQPRWKYQQANVLFADQRSSRPWPDGTVARNMLREDSHYYFGIVDGEWATGFPPQVEVNRALLDRGRERYAIYCAQCHGEAGYGDGPVSKRAELLREGTWTVPLTYHGDEVRARPVGHIFNTISNGIRSMPAHGTQVSVADRWAIIAWIRVLQESQHTDIRNLPPSKRGELEARRPVVSADPGSVAAPPSAADVSTAIEDAQDGRAEAEAGLAETPLLEVQQGSESESAPQEGEI